MDSKKLKEILENHKHWLGEDCDGWEDMQANLNNADFRGADLRKADLRGANLNNADLRGADLYMANLYMANLHNADFRGADLRRADLSGTDIRYADFREANLSRANFRGANLRRADLRRAENVPFIPLTCPDTGAFIGFKKADMRTLINGSVCIEPVIVELEIAADARRSSATGRMCRCDKAKVLSITTLTGAVVSEKAGTVRSHQDSEFVYKVGEIVTEPNFSEDRWEECAPGIHFFINRQEAVEY